MIEKLPISILVILNIILILQLLFLWHEKLSLAKAFILTSLFMCVSGMAWNFVFAGFVPTRMQFVNPGGMAFDILLIALGNIPAVIFLAFLFVPKLKLSTKSQIAIMGIIALGSSLVYQSYAMKLLLSFFRSPMNQ